MWIRFENYRVINLAQAVSIFIDHDQLFYVTAVFPAGNTEILHAFDNADDAKNFIDMLVDELNGNKPLGYAFNWLAKYAEKLETDDDSLIDGVSLNGNINYSY